MATTYLTLVNNVLNEMNEAELTSTTFSTSRGIQTAVKKFILKAFLILLKFLLAVDT